MPKNTSNFKALFIAKENIVFISLVEMVDAILKLALAYLLLYIQADKLLLYVFILAGIQLLNLLAFALYANWQFPECSLLIRKRDISRIYIGQLLGFAGWTTYGMGAVAAGLIAGVGIKLFVSIRNHPLGRPLCLAITALTIVAMAWLRWPLFWILPVIGGAACLLTWRKLAP